MGDTQKLLPKYVSCFGNLLFLIQTKNNYKFGIYMDEYIGLNRSLKYSMKELFIYSFNDKNPYNLKEEAVQNYEKDKDFYDYFLKIGDDLIIYNNFLENGGYINFPMKLFDLSELNNNIFTGQNGKFEIEDIEIYRLIPAYDNY